MLEYFTAALSEGDTSSHGEYELRYANEFTGSRGGRHVIEAFHPEDGKVARMEWMGRAPYAIHSLDVDPEHRRQGLATAMWDWAQQNARPKPRHSEQRTDMGEAWARSVGGRLPRRVSRRASGEGLFPTNRGNTMDAGISEYFGGGHGEADHPGRTAGRGKPRRDGGNRPAAPGGDQGGAPADAGRPQAGPGGAGVEGPRPVTFHPKAAKELAKLDGTIRKRAKGVVDALSQRGGEGVQTHALANSLAGYYSSKINHDHRIVHQPTDEGGIHIIYVGLHDYDQAARRVGAKDAQEFGGTVRMVPPEEYRKFRYPDYPSAATPAALVRHFKKTSPEYYDKIKSKVQEEGFTTPVLVRWNDPRGKPLRRPEVMEGHHRAAVAHELGMHLPVGDYDNPDDYDTAFKAGQQWFRENQRPAEGVSWKEAARKEDMEPHQRAVHEAQETVRLHHPNLTMSVTEESGTKHLRGVLGEHGYPRADEAFVHIHPGVRGFSSTAMDNSTGAMGVSLHPSRADYGTLLHETAHLLNDHATGRRFREDSSDEHVHGIGYVQQYAKLLQPWGRKTPGGNYQAGPGDMLLNEYYRSLNHKTASKRQRQCPCGQMAEFDPQDGWQHLDGSVTHDDPEGTSVSDLMKTAQTGEEYYDPDDGEYARLWDHWHPQLQPEMHRHLSMHLPGDHPAHDDRMPMHERAHAVLQQVSEGTPERPGTLGWHWTDDPSLRFLNTGEGRLQPGHTPVIVHAKTPPREHIEDNTWTLREDRAVKDWDHPEREVPLKRNAPVHVTGVSWRPAGGQMVRHDFEHPIVRYAGAQGDLPEGLRFAIEEARGGRRYHRINAHVPGRKEPVGSMMWDAIGDEDDPDTLPGEVFGLRVEPEYRRRGVANAMWDHARRHGPTPDPQHSLVQTEEGAAWARQKLAAHPLPTSRVFGPTYGLDHRLFTGEKLKPEVRTAVMARLGPVIEPVLGDDWQRYTKVYLAGSEASEWTSATLEGNSDFDTLIGVDYDHLKGEPGVPVADLDDQDITDALNTALREGYNASPWKAPFGGSWDLTGYCNAGSYDIRKIKPYAAYNITDDEWSVKPPHLPDWSIDKLPEGGQNLLAEAEGYAAVIEAISKMPEPFQTQQGKALWHHLHSDRGRAFSDEGEGWYDPGNLIEKALVEWGLWDKLVEWQYGKKTASYGGVPVAHVRIDKLWPHREWDHQADGHSYDREGGGPYAGKHDVQSWERNRQSVAEGGIEHPITLEYNPKAHSAYIGEGNHRLHWARELGHETVPVRVWRTSKDMHPRYDLPGAHRLPEGEHIPQELDPRDVLPQDWFPAQGKTAGRQIQPGVHHSDALTSDGAGWARKVSMLEYFAVKRSDHPLAPDLPPEQHEALDAEDYTQHKRKMLDLAKNPVPGTHIWRGELRAEDPVKGARETGVGIHWGVNPDTIVRPQAGDGEHEVVYHAEIENPEEQSFSRSHPMWQGRHMSMDSEAEVRLKPGSRVKLHGVWYNDPYVSEKGYFTPTKPERMGKQWSYHPINEYVQVAHRPSNGLIDYSDVGVKHEGMLGYFTADYRLMHTPPDENSGKPMHEYEGGDPDDLVRIYRSVPRNVDYFDTNTWASSDPDYAHLHGRDSHDPSKDWPVISAEVPKKHVFWDENDPNEVGYQGPRLESHQIELHDEETGEHRPYEHPAGWSQHAEDRGGDFFHGMSVHLPQEDHDFVHDPRNPKEERALRLFKHVPQRIRENGTPEWTEDADEAVQDSHDFDREHGWEDHDTPETHVVVHGSQNLEHAHGISWAPEDSHPTSFEDDMHHHEFTGDPNERLSKQSSIADYFGMAA